MHRMLLGLTLAAFALATFAPNTGAFSKTA